MKTLGRMACLLAVLGLLSQLLASSIAAVQPVGEHSAATSRCGDCPGEPSDSHCPADPLHDHCGSLCVHFFTAISQGADAFQVRNSRAREFLSSRAETVPEGFPTGLFIPPRAS
ncbi:MAG TPA: hypothetical protein PLS03_07185 [Terrimicrobiaceae bacterium]|nr:hypothetical protein [Terrimicrobiaceae bacterium]